MGVLSATKDNPFVTCDNPELVQHALASGHFVMEDEGQEFEPFAHYEALGIEGFLGIERPFEETKDDLFKAIDSAAKKDLETFAEAERIDLGEATKVAEIREIVKAYVVDTFSVNQEVDGNGDDDADGDGEGEGVLDDEFTNSLPDVD